MIALAKLYSWRVYHTHWSKHSEAGFPDLCLVRPPRLVFAELKVWPRTTPRPEQAAWLADLGAVAGVEAHLWVWAFGNDIEREIAEVLGA